MAGKRLGDKRASMREGPLAALFRRTDAPAPGADNKGSADQGSADAPQNESEQAPPAEAQQPLEPTPQPQPPETARTEPSAVDVAPKDRLAKVFSMDMPDDMMHGAGNEILEPSSDPVAPRYGRELPGHESTGAPPPAGGGGGAGRARGPPASSSRPSSARKTARRPTITLAGK